MILWPLGVGPVVEVDHPGSERVRTCPDSCRRRAAGSGRRCSPRARCTGTRRRRRTRRSCRSGRPDSLRAPPRAASSNDLPAAFARAAIVVRSRSVSNGPGSRLLIVTLCRATLRASPATKPVRPRARAVGQAEDVDRRLHRRRRDVDDAAELARDHAVDRRLDELDRRQHVGVERADPRVAVPVAEIAGRRAAGVVDQDVGLGHAASAAARPSGVVMSQATHADARARSRAPISAAVAPQRRPRCARRSSRRSRRRPAPAAQPRPSPLLAAQTSARRPAMPRSMSSLPQVARGAAARRIRMTVPIATTSSAATHEEHPAPEPVVEHERRTTPARSSRRGRGPNRRSRRRAPPRPCGVALRTIRSRDGPVAPSAKPIEREQRAGAAATATAPVRHDAQQQRAGERGPRPPRGRAAPSARRGSRRRGCPRCRRAGTR